ncbi:MAG: hypothetical protein U9N59_00425 [Campylobacterota bacterium]|nr:hypothetical protein [Campylobacterota bacterium]
MYKIGKILLLASVAILFSACAGKNFEKPSQKSLVLGTTTYTDITNSMGTPKSSGKLLLHNNQFDSITYIYANIGCQKDENSNADISNCEPNNRGVTPEKAMIFYFKQEILKGYSFRSSFKSNNTNFDATKVEKIIKNKTNMSGIISLLGKPTGKLIYPASLKANTFVYEYSEAIPKAFGGAKVHVKVLIIEFDKNDIVIDVKYVNNRIEV